MKKDEEFNPNQAKSNGTTIGDAQIQSRNKKIGFEENILIYLFLALVVILLAIFSFTTKLPSEDSQYKHDLVSRVVCDKVLPFTNEISKETTFSKNIRKIEVLDDGVEVTAVLDEATVGMPNDILEIEIITKVNNNSIIRLGGQIVVKDAPNDQVGTGFYYDVVGDNITVRENSSATKLFNYSFSMESGISTWKNDGNAIFALAGLRSLICTLSLLGIYKIVIKGINYRRRNQEKAIVKTFFLYTAQLLGILMLIFLIIILIDNAYA